MPYLGRAPTGTGSVTEIDGDLTVTGNIKSGGQLTSNDTLFKQIMDGTDGSSTNARDNIIIEDGGTDGSGTNAGDDICLEKDLQVIPAGDIISISGVAGGGKIVQSLYSEYAGEATLSTTIPLDDTIPQVGEGTELFSQAITASDGSNIIEISAIVNGAPQGTATLIAALFLDGGGDAIYACVLGHDGVGGNQSDNGTLRYRVAAADTSAHTYTVRVGCNSGAWFPNSNASGDKFAGTAKCTMVVTEYSA